MRTATIFADRVSVRAAEEVFAGYLDGTDWTKGENRRLSRAHRQPNRIYGTGGGASGHQFVRNPGPLLDSL